MIDEKFVFLAVVLILFGDLIYLIGTIKGKIKPNKVTWLLWALAGLMAFGGELSEGAGISSLMTFAVGAGPLLIFSASFLNKKSYWKITSFDLICGAVSLAGLILWGITRTGNWAILFAILADGLAAVPTVIKSYKAPDTESDQAYLLNGIGAVITLLTIKNWSFAYYAFPLYILIICSVFFLLIKFKLGKNLPLS